MSEIDVEFSRKANAFTRGQVDLVVQKLASRSKVTVGDRQYEFCGTDEAHEMLERYRSGLRGYGYSHTHAVVRHQEQIDDDTAYALVEYVHSDYDGQLLDELFASYFLTRCEKKGWQTAEVEFLEEPLAFDA